MSGFPSGSIIRFAALVIAVATVAWGFYLVGSPAFNRKLASDRDRIADLQNLQRQIEYYFERQKALPETLQKLEALPYGRGPNLVDPITKNPYEYRVVDKFSYELCTTFTLSSEAAAIERMPNSMPYHDYYSFGNWSHPEGRHCFALSIPERSRNLAESAATNAH